MGRNLDTIVPSAHQEDDSHASGRVIRSQRILNSLEVLQGLGHLGTRDGQVTHVEEVVDPGVLSLAVLAEVGLTLGQLIVVVRECEINATRVNVHLSAQNIRGHD